MTMTTTMEVNKLDANQISLEKKIFTQKINKKKNYHETWGSEISRQYSFLFLLFMNVSVSPERKAHVKPILQSLQNDFPSWLKIMWICVHNNTAAPAFARRKCSSIKILFTVNTNVKVEGWISFSAWREFWIFSHGKTLTISRYFRLFEHHLRKFYFSNVRISFCAFQWAHLLRFDAAND